MKTRSIKITVLFQKQFDYNNCMTLEIDWLLTFYWLDIR